MNNGMNGFRDNTWEQYSFGRISPMVFQDAPSIKSHIRTNVGQQECNPRRFVRFLVGRKVDLEKLKQMVVDVNGIQVKF
jgi:hypothetical protein